METNTILDGHFQATANRCRAASGKFIVVAQDSTYLNYSGQLQMDGLGVIQDRILGFVQHNALAMDEQGRPLGMVYQRTWSREGENDFENESQKWLEGIKFAQERLAGTGKKIVVVQDREADQLSLLERAVEKGLNVVVRVFQHRKYRHTTTEGQDIIAPLKQMATVIPEVGNYKVWVRKNNRPVELTLCLKAAKVEVLQRYQKPSSLPPLYLVSATEIAATDEKGHDVFNATDAAQWLLLTTIPAENIEQATEIVRIYAMRWMVERFHFTLKSGALNVERFQFDDAKTTFNALALYAVIAWRIMTVKIEADKDPDIPAHNFFDPREVQILEAKVKKKVNTLFEAIQAVGKLVNFVPTKKQPLPGIKIMMQGFEALHHMRQAMLLFQLKPLQD